MSVVRVKKKMNPWLKTLIVFLVILVIILLALNWFEKTFRINVEKDVKVMIIGDGGRYTEEDIKKYVLDERFEQYWILLKWYYRSNKVDPPPYLEKITVEVGDDGSVLLKAYEKNPIGALWEMGNYLYFDSDGMLVSTKKENVEGLPVIKGLKYSSVTLGKVFETQNPALFQVIMKLVRQLEKQNVNADVVQFHSDNSVTLYCDGNVIELGIRDAYDVQIQVLSSILEKIMLQDVRYSINMEHVEKGDEKIIATIIEEDGDENDDDVSDDSSDDANDFK